MPLDTVGNLHKISGQIIVSSLAYLRLESVGRQRGDVQQEFEVVLSHEDVTALQHH